MDKTTEPGGGEDDGGWDYEAALDAVLSRYGGVREPPKLVEIKEGTYIADDAPDVHDYSVVHAVVNRKDGTPLWKFYYTSLEPDAPLSFQHATFIARKYVVNVKQIRRTRYDPTSNTVYVWYVEIVRVFTIWRRS